MSIKTSYSQSNTYISCSRHWYNKYVERYDSLVEGASTHFGSAFDAAITAMLLGKTDYYQIFSDKFYSALDRNKQPTQIYDNVNIVYSNQDYDEHALKPEDEQVMADWIKELGLGKLGSEGKDVMSKIQKVKRNPYKKLKESELRFYNRASWLSLKRKGEILMEAFKDQFLPRVEKVLDTQKYAFIKDANTGDSITGFIDFVLKLKDYDKPVIIDLKTSASAYRQDKIDNSDQLTLYAALEGQRYNTDLVGYVVCVKNIRKEKVAYCSKCGSKRDGRHKTCNVQVPEGQPPKDVRCSGPWVEKVELKPEIQVLIEKKTDKQLKDILIDQGNIIEAMRQQIVYKNTDKCNNWYGSRCIYYDLCHNDDPSNLIKKS